MYKANPKVNVELKQRLPSPIRIHCSETTPQLGLLLPHSISGISQSPCASEEVEKALPPVPPPPCPPKSPSQSPVLPSLPANKSTQTGGAMEEDGIPLHPGLDYNDEKSTLSSPELPSTSPSQRNVLQDQGTAKAHGSADSKRQVPVLDKEKNIAFLLKELDSLRDLNKKLQDKMSLKEKELETKLLDGQLLDSQMEAQACERTRVLVEEIYKAQRQRDEAVMARLRLANEERDEALLRAKKLQQAAMELENISPEESDMDLEELLNQVNSADSALGIERSGAAILERLQKARERRAKITAEEMKAVMEERDSALAKCKRLEQDLHVREQSQTSSNNGRHLSAENNQARVRKEELEASQRDRDKALELCQRLQEELQMLRIVHSQHQAETENAEMKEVCSPACTTPTSPTNECQSLLRRLQLLTSEHQNTMGQLQISQEAEREARERVQKLERLVEVLRKKVGTGSVRKVI
ncbi:mirror-image polydactyly gene 1 protein [Denticeps clupeoides]|nr:mirror-image polydactyly gene 1 protein [Denticeps clupeoides]